VNLGGFSIWRLIGVSAFKSRLSRRIGIPLTKSGRQRKLGAFMDKTPVPLTRFLRVRFGSMFADATIRWTDPSTSPWMFYVWAAFALTGLAKPAWSWFRRQRAGGWPVAEGRIESVEVSKPSFSFTTKRGSFVAELGYSYSVAGTSHSGCYRRDFPTEHEADEFVRDLKGNPVAVHCKSTSPSSSALLEPDIEVLLQNRAPAPTADFTSAANSVPDWIRPFLWFFVLFSAIGLVISLWIHIGALMGRTVSSAFWVLHVGIFLVWFPSVLVAQRLVGNTSRKDFWKVVLKGAPDWMRYMVYVFFRLRLCELHVLHGSDSQRRSSHHSFSRRLERVLRSLDGVLFRCACHSVFCRSHCGCQPPMYERACGISECGELPPVRSTCATSSVRSETVPDGNSPGSRPTKSPECQGLYLNNLNTSPLSGTSTRLAQFHCLQSIRLQWTDSARPDLWTARGFWS